MTLEQIRDRWRAEATVRATLGQFGDNSDVTLRRCAADLDAYLAREQAKTCATCRHWCAGRFQGEEMRAAYIRHGWNAECGLKGLFRSMFTVYVYGDGRVEDYHFDTLPTFGCTLHKSITEG